MAGVATLPFLDIQATLDGWAAASGSSDEERIEFANNALRELRSDPNQFEEIVKGWQVGIWANKVDASFDTVTRKFEEMGTEYRAKFPKITEYLYEWIGFRKVRSSFHLVYAF